MNGLREINRLTRISYDLAAARYHELKLLVSVKAGDQEGYLEELLGFTTRIYFTYFQEEEIARYLTGNGFEILFLESRKALQDEIAVPRIFAIGGKR